jgi:hypothetical protein
MENCVPISWMFPFSLPFAIGLVEFKPFRSCTTAFHPEVILFGYWKHHATLLNTSEKQRKKPIQFRTQLSSGFKLQTKKGCVNDHETQHLPEKLYGSPRRNRAVFC